MSSVLSLPYDVLREILTGLSAVDVLSFLRVSRRLYYPLIDDDSTWHTFCARYGVADPSAFGRRSFRTIYGRLLHRYGALLGPWCSDYPCRGNIVEFRLVPDNWLRGGEWIMIGEVWEFKRKAHSQPEYPCYTEFVQIGFTLPKRATRQTANDVHISWHLRSERDLGFLVHNGIPPPWVRMDGNGRLATPSLHVIAPSDQKVATDVDHILNINEMFPTVPWYDAVRGVPRLPQEGPPPLKKESSSRWYDSWSDHAVHYVPGVAKPAAIAFFPPPAGKECDVRVNGLHNPPHYFSIYFEHAVSRYYPLRHPEKMGDDPASSEWRAETLEGLWLGDYGVHGTECLFLEYDAVESVVRAWKITGDAHVPRGVCSWEIELKRPTSDFGPSRRSYEGQGTLAPRGFV
ncbi:hypothetical protein BN946_scf184354.g4 [Trametes cinnabarina]|uniref:F-box domain-containing protein n=1 Tax=Pycnoporus cinnabarinus TaxID=5643 RepID=A0A060S687_PYCCI|nr:hypothetical protein BN946_scf184354.g4 [Trametes cinnabarina]